MNPSTSDAGGKQSVHLLVLSPAARGSQCSSFGFCHCVSQNVRAVSAPGGLWVRRGASAGGGKAPLGAPGRTRSHKAFHAEVLRTSGVRAGPGPGGAGRVKAAWGGRRAGGSGRRARLRRLPVSSSGAAAPGRAPAPRRAGPGGGRVAGPESGARQRWNGSAAGCIGFGISELRFS